jgi:glycosyltransferase involved in cell wall biosynthesis
LTLRLGFHYHTPATFDNDNHRIRTPGYQGVFIDSLAARCEKMICFLHEPRPSEESHMDYLVQADNVELVSVGPHVSALERTVHARRFVQPLEARRADLDVILIRGPSPLLPGMARQARPLPYVLLVVGDYLATVSALQMPWWKKELLGLYARWNTYQQIQVARRTLTFTNSQKLYNELTSRVPELRLTKTTTLSQNDFFERADTCAAPPFRLLYTGRMNRSKGLFEMIDAVAQLTAEGIETQLNWVGWADGGDSILADLRAFAEAKGVAERVVYHGIKAVGPELFAYYKQADIYLISSLSDFEGFPRTIWEALAHSVPVIATRVGSIPLTLNDHDTALLIPPRDSRAIAGGIRELIQNPVLRQTLIRNGRGLVRENTLENRAQEMISEIECWLERS